MVRSYKDTTKHVDRSAGKHHLAVREGTVAGYAHLAVDRWRGSRRATPLAPMLDINHIPMEMLQFLLMEGNCQILLDVHLDFI